MPNPLTGAVEGNGTSIVDVTDPARPGTSLISRARPKEERSRRRADGARMQRKRPAARGQGKWYLLRSLGSEAHEIYDVTDKARPTRLTTIVDGLSGTHKSWWECDTGIAYLVANKAAEGWKGNHLKIYDLGDPAKPVYIRDFGLLGQQPGATSFQGVRAGIQSMDPFRPGLPGTAFTRPTARERTVSSRFSTGTSC